MFRLARFMRPFRRQLITGPIFKFIEAVFELIIPLVVAHIIDRGISQHDAGHVIVWGVVMILLGLTGLGCALVCQYSAARASIGFGTLVRRELFGHITTLSQRELDEIGTPSLITRLTNDINRLQWGVAMMMRLVVRSPFIVIGSVFMAFTIDAGMAVIFMTAAPLLALCYFAVMRLSLPIYSRIQSLLDKLSLVTRENLSGARVVRAFSRQDAERRRFADTTDALCGEGMRAGRLTALLNPATSLIANLAIVCILWFGGGAVNTGSLTQGQVYALVNYMTQNLLALIVVTTLVPVFTQASASGKRVQAVFDLRPSVTDEMNAPVAVVDGSPKIELRGASFRYSDSGGNALEDVSVSIEAGQTVGIIGATGAGKSTLARLIARFYDVVAGEVLIDGVNVKSYPLRQLRGKIGYVPQKAALFTGTLRENMLWKDETATDADIWAALKTAQADSFVRERGEGLDMMLLQGGKNLSGGQKQRLTIARALVGSPEILILDDSASALDFATDAALRRALRHDTRDATVLLISQRVNTVRSAGKIVVLDDGRVAGVGTHEQLYEGCGIYREICLSQLRAEEAQK